MKIAVVGSRSFDDWDAVCEVMECLTDIYENAEFISGGAKGVDSTVAEWCEKNVYHIEVIRPNYKEAVNPKAAPLARNSEIVARCDQLVAFWDGESRGTLDAIRKAVKAGKFVQIFSTKGEYN